MALALMTILPCSSDMLYNLGSFYPVISYRSFQRRVRRNLGLEPREACGNRLRVVWVFGGGLAWTALPVPLLSKRTFSQRAKLNPSSAWSSGRRGQRAVLLLIRGADL